MSLNVESYPPLPASPPAGGEENMNGYMTNEVKGISHYNLRNISLI